MNVPLEQTEFDLVSLRDLIVFHRTSAAATAEKIPATMNIGLFSVNLGDLRTVLAKKHLEVSPVAANLPSSRR